MSSADMERAPGHDTSYDLDRPEPDEFYYEVTINVINSGKTPSS
jgi:hypothetical protein